MTKFYENWKKLHISNILGFFTHYSRIFFPGKSNSAFFFHYFLISTVATHNFRKTNEQIPRKTVYRSTDIDRSLIDFLSIVIKKW